MQTDKKHTVKGTKTTAEAWKLYTTYHRAKIAMLKDIIKQVDKHHGWFKFTNTKEDLSKDLAQALAASYVMAEEK